MDKKLADHLWTARWAVKAGKPDVADAEITDALVHIGAESRQSVEDSDRPDDPMPEDFEAGFTEPIIRIVKGVRYKSSGAFRTPSGKFSGLVVHYTVSGRTEKSARAVVSYLASKGLGCMVMDEDGIIYVPEGFDVFRTATAHAGASAWNGQRNLNQYFAGMEICCWGRGSKVGPFRESKGEANIVAGKYQTYTDAQERALTDFILWARAKNPEFKLDNVVGHDEVRTAVGKRGDKQDPGASLSMTMPEYRAHLSRLGV